MYSAFENPPESPQCNSVIAEFEDCLRRLRAGDKDATTVLWIRYSREVAAITRQWRRRHARRHSVDASTILLDHTQPVTDVL